MDIILFLLVLSYVGAEPICKTVEGKVGQCVPIDDCPRFKPLTLKPKRTDEEIGLLSKSMCGYENSILRVCCPKTEHIYTKNKCGDKNPDHENEISDDDDAYADECKAPAKPAIPVIAKKPCELKDLPPQADSECCGVERTSNRIMGGQIAGVSKYPWLALIEYIKYNEISIKCGGSLISGRYVLTAAHCVTGDILDMGTPRNVRLGEHNTKNPGRDCWPAEGGREECNDGAISIPIQKSIPHPEYKPSTMTKRNDIALIRMGELVKYTDFIRPLCLPTRDWTAQDVLDATLIIAGWGGNETHMSSQYKTHVDLILRDKKECQDIHNKLRKPIELWEKQICAGGHHGKNPCKGDSGGPLMYLKDHTYEAVGIISFSYYIYCGQKDFPAVFTKVYPYMDWIMHNIKH